MGYGNPDDDDDYYYYLCIFYFDFYGYDVDIMINYQYYDGI